MPTCWKQNQCQSAIATGPTPPIADGDPLLYWSIVGALQYATMTHPDNSHGVKYNC